MRVDRRVLCLFLFLCANVFVCQMSKRNYWLAKRKYIINKIFETYMQVNPIISQSTREIRKHDFLRVGSHWVQVISPKVTWGQYVQSQLLKAWMLGLTTSHGSEVFKPKYDIDAYMATLFGGEVWDLRWQLGQAKSWTQLSTQIPWIVLHKIINIQL